MAIDNFIPEVWAAGVTQSFIANQVVIPTLNNAFTGDVVAGNKVHIINATTPTIVDYAGAGRTISAEALNDTEVELDIDQEKAPVSPNPMDPNWGGATYTQSLVDKGFYKDDEVQIYIP